MNKILPCGDRVLLQIVVAGESKIGSIIVPEKADRNMRDAITARVLAVGPGRVSEYNGVLVECTQKVGDLVLIDRNAGRKVQHSEDGELRLIQSVEILATVEESRIELLR